MKAIEIRRNIRLGIFVAVAILLVLLALFTIGGQNNLFAPTFPLQVEFRNVQGLQGGDRVLFSGVGIGNVTDVEIVQDTVIRVQMKIKERVRPFIKKNSTATITTDGLVGNKIVVIEPGDAASGPVDDEDFIVAKTEAGAQELINTLTASGQNVMEVTGQLKRIAQGLEEGRGTFGMLLKDDQMAASLQQAALNIQVTGRNSATITGDIRSMVNQLQRNREGLVSTLLTDTSFSRVYDQTLTNIRVTGENTAEATGDFSRFTDKLNNEEGSLNVLLADTAFANDLQRTLTNTARGTEALAEDAEALQKTFLLRGVFRRQRKQEAKAREQAQEEAQQKQ
ncbi:phospholipid/cholesterol/gamma-HCH transport system substrate-binding protein [Catalinimonas alkaloidigena]|uniref:Phospholipid/cholesterol/gamma-HCH transport system substrate-binding protein n=1 Tax=Catalinimonas alkaloidigena TaxID=1075417 RepID=A0A1G9GQW8_9BACT|nr:MlaD family protein [Catalinimonas alkaloidigena]SDL03081.1 phospholipid/cholesterol/gamma-HCH transport system substrate-binding protein [Catalinimonas alkaloidigena]